MGCFVGETLVLMANRVEMPIERIRPGYMVMAFDSNGILWPSKVINVFPTKVYSVDALEFHNGRPIIGTERHPFWQKGKKFTPSRSITFSVTYADGEWNQSTVNDRRTLHFTHGIWVYNLEVSTYRTYIANGHAVHNRKPSVE